jgi:hypothetical protein
MEDLLMRSKLLVALFAAALLEASWPTPGWDRMKSLVGAWRGTAAGQSVSVTYALVSNGTALMETLDGGHDATMVTMYTPDGAAILATHYCSAGNQPRMRAKGSADGKSLAFEFVDVANVAGSTGEVMRRLVVTFVDADHFEQQWTSRGADGKELTSVFEYTRRTP